MKQAVEEGASVTHRQNKAISIEPRGIFGIVVEHSCPQCIRNLDAISQTPILSHPHICDCQATECLSLASMAQVGAPTNRSAHHVRRCPSSCENYQLLRVFGLSCGSKEVTGAMAMGVPGCPDCAFWTASSGARTRRRVSENFLHCTTHSQSFQELTQTTEKVHQIVNMAQQVTDYTEAALHD
eukprot:3920605-Amphidinium_carterae.1